MKRDLHEITDDIKTLIYEAGKQGIKIKCIVPDDWVDCSSATNPVFVPRCINFEIGLYD